LTVLNCSTFNDAVRKRVPMDPETDLRYEGLPTGKRAAAGLSLGELNIRLGDPFAREKVVRRVQLSPAGCSARSVAGKGGAFCFRTGQPSSRFPCIRVPLDCSKDRRGRMLQTRQTEAGLLIVVVGRIDSATAEGFKNAVLTEVGEDPQAVVLDLGAVAYVSSAGLRALLQIAKSRSQGVRLCCLRPEVQGVFSMSGFDRILPLFESREDAFAGTGI